MDVQRGEYLQCCNVYYYKRATFTSKTKETRYQRYHESETPAFIEKIEGQFYVHVQNIQILLLVIRRLSDVITASVAISPVISFINSVSFMLDSDKMAMRVSSHGAGIKRFKL